MLIVKEINSSEQLKMFMILSRIFKTDLPDMFRIWCASVCGNFFVQNENFVHARNNADAMNSRGASANQQTPRNSDHNSMDTQLLQENSNFIHDLTDCGSFLENLDMLLSGSLPFPSDVAGQTLVFDPDTLKSYIHALNLKADQLRKIKLLLGSQPNIPNADLMEELLKEVEPKLKAMSLRLSRERNLLAKAGKAEGRQNEAACSTVQDQVMNAFRFCTVLKSFQCLIYPW